MTEHKALCNAMLANFLYDYYFAVLNIWKAFSHELILLFYGIVAVYQLFSIMDTM